MPFANASHAIFDNVLHSRRRLVFSRKGAAREVTKVYFFGCPSNWDCIAMTFLEKGSIMAHPVIDTDECVACGVCVDTCPCDVLELGDDAAQVKDEDSCVACGSCQEACPAGAITEIAED